MEQFRINKELILKTKDSSNGKDREKFVYRKGCNVARILVV